MENQTAPDTATVVIVGAGPAGIAAADVLGGLGVDTVVLDEQDYPGGQIYRNVVAANEALLRVLGPEYRRGRSLIGDVKHDSLNVLNEASVWEITTDGTIYYSRRNRSRALRARHVLLATGAIERPMPFPGWTLPGVMTAGGLQIGLKTSGIVPNGKLVLAGSGPLLLLLARQLLSSGTEIAAIVETTPNDKMLSTVRLLPKLFRSKTLVSEGLDLLRVIRRHNIKHYKKAGALRAVGEHRVEALSFKSDNRQTQIECDVLGIHNGVVPNTQLTRQIGLAHRWHDSQRYWYPDANPYGQTDLPWLCVLGDGGGIAGSQAATLNGVIAAWTLAGEKGFADPRTAADRLHGLKKQIQPLIEARRFIDQLYRPTPEFLVPIDDETIVCRCEEVSAQSIRDYVDLGCLGPNQTKAFGRPGMGPCQGRYCGLTVGEIIADQRNVPVESVGYYRIRPPVKPVTFSELGSLAESP